MRALPVRILKIVLISKRKKKITASSRARAAMAKHTVDVSLRMPGSSACMDCRWRAPSVRLLLQKISPSRNPNMPVEIPVRIRLFLYISFLTVLIADPSLLSLRFPSKSMHFLPWSVSFFPFCAVIVPGPPGERLCLWLFPPEGPFSPPLRGAFWYFPTAQRPSFCRDRS